MLIIGKKLSPYALLSISGLLAASDQAVKWLVQQSMAYGEYVSVTPFFNWVHLWNTGAAFSLFANGGGWQRYLFIGIAVVVSIFLAIKGTATIFHPHCGFSMWQIGGRILDFGISEVPSDFVLSASICVYPRQKSFSHLTTYHPPQPIPNPFSFPREN